MSAPKRIQRKRTPGWRMPEGAVYVGRASRWGNPFRWESSSTIAAIERGGITRAAIVESRADAVQMLRSEMQVRARCAEGRRSGAQTQPDILTYHSMSDRKIMDSD